MTFSFASNSFGAYIKDCRKCACAIHPYLAASGDTYEQEATASLALRTPRFAGDFLQWVVLATICLALPSGILMAVLWHREICI